MSKILHLDYRPVDFDEVVGQAAAVRALQGLVRRGSSRAFLLTGPSGTGKTTLARIVARALGCADTAAHIVEIDAATNTGIDAMRRVQEMTQFAPFGENKWRALIIDEAHALSKAAWQSLLKSIEEPPEFVAWFFCTTEPGKVPATIKTRCSAVALKPVADADLRRLMDRVAAAEKIKLDREVREVVLREAAGSPRQMLVNMEMCRDAKSRREASELLRSAAESEPAIELAKFLLSGGGSWPKAASILAKLEGEAAESVRIAVCNYIGGALRRAASNREACRLLSLVEPFADPFPAGSERAALALATGRALFAERE